MKTSSTSLDVRSRGSSRAGDAGGQSHKDVGSGGLFVVSGAGIDSEISIWRHVDRFDGRMSHGRVGG